MTHPYLGLPDRQFWKNEPGVKAPGLLDPMHAPGFSISRDDRIVTAGSCFAQHVGQFLCNAGFSYLVTENAHPVIPEKVAIANHYGQFSARYGNIYSGRQLRQLIERAYGHFAPKEDAWPAQKGDSVVDPFRPQIQPGGFESVDELLCDRKQHFEAVRKAFETMNVFVFTLGLTEAWEDTRDGAIYPLAPGVAGGDFDTTPARFRNFDVVETADDVLAAFTEIRRLNPTCRIIVTVSPVPLNATYEDRHVLVSTTYSKSVLRVVAEQITKRFPMCDYFPSYEIITSPHVRGRYYAHDCRTVRAAGIEHVMRTFLKHYSAEATSPTTVAAPEPSAIQDAHSEKMKSIVEALCDEEAIDNR